MPSTFFPPLSTERPLRTTLAPSSANISAIVRPMPRVGPVISATWPSSLVPLCVMEASSRSGEARRQPVSFSEGGHLAEEAVPQAGLLVGGRPAGLDGVERDVLDRVGVVPASTLSA